MNLKNIRTSIFEQLRIPIFIVAVFSFIYMVFVEATPLAQFLTLFSVIIVTLFGIPISETPKEKAEAIYDSFYLVALFSVLVYIAGAPDDRVFHLGMFTVILMFFAVDLFFEDNIVNKIHQKLEG